MKRRPDIRNPEFDDPESLTERRLICSECGEEVSSSRFNPGDPCACGGEYEEETK